MELLQLCVGDKVGYSCRVIYSDEEETYFREKGFVEYEFLPDPVDTSEDSEG